MRTYFRDRQIHISADVVYGLWQYYLATGDESFLVESASEIILECARFFYSYSYFKKDKNSNELLYMPEPGENDMVIPQFDNYNKLEDIGLSEIKHRMKNSNEYLGGGNGL